jgi:hypothetical protein
VWEIRITAGVMVGDNQLCEADGWCLALKYGLGHHMGWYELCGFVMCWLLAIYLCWNVEGTKAESALDEIVAECWPGDFLNEMNWPCLEESINLEY